MQYRRDDWLFIERAWAKADGVELKLPAAAKYTGGERDNSGGAIGEWLDTPILSAEDAATVRALMTAKSATVRFEGKQYYADRKLTEKQLAAMREVVVAYEAVTGKPWNGRYR